MTTGSVSIPGSFIASSLARSLAPSLPPSLPPSLDVDGPVAGQLKGHGTGAPRVAARHPAGWLTVGRSAAQAEELHPGHARPRAPAGRPPRFGNFGRSRSPEFWSPNRRRRGPSSGAVRIRAALSQTDSASDAAPLCGACRTRLGQHEHYLPTATQPHTPSYPGPDKLRAAGMAPKAPESHRLANRRDSPKPAALSPPTAAPAGRPFSRRAAAVGQHEGAEKSKGPAGRSSRLAGRAIASYCRCICTFCFLSR